MRFQCINTKGEVVTIETFGYYNPDMAVRLFSPQAFFSRRPKKDGAFTISWSKLFLEFENGKDEKEILPCFIDRNSFMPLLTCFHDAGAVALNLSSETGCVTNNDGNITATQRLLLRFHYKLGHLGFKHLQWFLNSGVLGLIGKTCADPSTPQVSSLSPRRPTMHSHCYQHLHYQSQRYFAA